ncbi:hypothetical protein ABTX62_00755 [Streptomyces sp. NPDC096046]|uniref:hypothetical protein n=1 Tax=Streptomyces sp. NPDC096046 TaxID=3155542 RepID=UPI0033309CEA
MRPHAQSRNSGKNHPSRHARAKGRPGGVIHDNTRHTTRFTVIGNHLTQLPPLPPFRTPEPPPPVRHPLRNCDTCDRGYRGPDPHTCRDCRERSASVLASGPC